MGLNVSSTFLGCYEIITPCLSEGLCLYAQVSLPAATYSLKFENAHQ